MIKFENEESIKKYINNMTKLFDTTFKRFPESPCYEPIDWKTYSGTITSANVETKEVKKKYKITIETEDEGFYSEMNTDKIERDFINTILDKLENKKEND